MEIAVETPAAIDSGRLLLEDFDAVVSAHWPGVFRFALVSLRDADLAATVAQDCFWKAWRSRGRFRGEASLRTWLMQIAVNVVRDAARSRRLQFWKRAQDASRDFEALAATLADGRESPETAASAREQLRAVWQAVRGLPERQRTVFLLRFTEEMELLEIASVTGMAEGTVKAHLFRALRAVRQAMGHEGL
jgi:RNA polymerase sigma-70 factor, ECF subfamily